MKTKKIAIAQPTADHRANNEIFVGTIEPDILVSAEYARVYGKRMFGPEQQLMVSVLKEAVADFQRLIFARDKKGARRFANAESWILSDDSDWVFSFDNCCSVLGIEPNYLRKGLLAWREQQLAQAKSSCRQSSKNIFRQAA
jgi:hypothetical protein